MLAAPRVRADAFAIDAYPGGLESESHLGRAPHR